MADLDLLYTPATELAQRIRQGELSPVKLMENCLARIEQINPVLNCFCFVYPDEALALAHQAEQDLAQGKPLGPLHGFRLQLKMSRLLQGKPLPVDRKCTNTGYLTKTPSSYNVSKQQARLSLARLPRRSSLTAALPKVRYGELRAIRGTLNAPPVVLPVALEQRLPAVVLL